MYSQIQTQELDFRVDTNLVNFDGPRSSHQSVIVNNYLYVLGGYVWANNQATVYNDVQFIPINSKVGVDNRWTKTKNLNLI